VSTRKPTERGAAVRGSAMTPESVGPLSRPVSVAHLPPEGLDVTVTATSEECAALARDFGLPAISALSGQFRLTGSADRAQVAGRVAASITQVCVVTLEPFDSVLEEDVTVAFAPGEAGAQPAGADDDPPDAIVDGRIDLGALTAEFLALGLDPYPRKPGAAFAFEGDGSDPDSPFAALRRVEPDG
jgi:hypothetical protein